MLMEISGFQKNPKNDEVFMVYEISQKLPILNDQAYKKSPIRTAPLQALIIRFLGVSQSSQKSSKLTHLAIKIGIPG